MKLYNKVELDKQSQINRFKRQHPTKAARDKVKQDTLRQLDHDYNIDHDCHRSADDGCPCDLEGGK